MTCSNIEIFINEENAYYFHLYEGRGFNFIYPNNNDLCNYWKYLKGYYFLSIDKGYKIYDIKVFKTFPLRDSVVLKNSIHCDIDDKLIFEFPDKETAFYFKLKYC